MDNRTTRRRGPTQVMAVPEIDLARIRRWVDGRNGRIGEHLDEVRIEMDVDQRAVTILECRPPWSDQLPPEWSRHPVARVRYTKSTGLWTLYWPDRNGRFHRYDEVEPTTTLADLLAEIDDDPTCIFWG